MTRNDVVRAAAEEEGNRDATRYWREVLPTTWIGPYPPHWCGAFALWCLRQADLCWWVWEIGRGFLFHLPTTRHPQPGDIAYKAEPFQHHAVVAEVREDGTIVTVDGNAGPHPTRVVVHASKVSDWTAFYSIGKLVLDGD